MSLELSPITGSASTTIQMVKRVRDLLGESVADLYDDTADILPELIVGVDTMFSTLRVLQKTFTAALVAAQSEYPLPDLTEMLRLYYRTSINGTFQYQELHSISGEDIWKVFDLTASTPMFYTTDTIDDEGATQVVVYPEPMAAIAGDLYGIYFGQPAVISAELNPAWHKKFHFLPCYYAASVLLRRDRRPEAAQEMMYDFERGVLEYQNWYDKQRPYVPDIIACQPSPNAAFSSGQAYPYLIGQ